MGRFTRITVLIISNLVIILSGLFAQNAPVTTASTFGAVEAGPVEVQVTVTDFTDIGAISLSIDYDYSVMHFIDGIPNPFLSNFPTGEIDLGTGYHRISMGWYGSGTTLNDGDTIMTLQFTYIQGISSLEWYDNGPSCEYADADFNVLNDLPTEDYYINGYVCGVIGDPGTISGEDTVCQGQAGVIYSVGSVENATAFTWSVPPNATIITGQGTNSITVDFSANAGSGIVSVYGENDCGPGESSEADIIVNPMPQADAGNDTIIPYGTYITLHATAGGEGSYSYHWMPEDMLVDPDVPDPQTANLELTTVFTVTVTNLETLCQDNDAVTVTITGGPLSVNPVASPPVICFQDSSQLISNAGGGSGNYTISWTCSPAGSPPWSSEESNPTVSPDTTTIYYLTVDDGFNMTSDTTYLEVDVRPTATISGGDTLCGSGEFAYLPVDLTGNPPWSFTYTYGSTSVYVYNQDSSPYTIIASDPGNYTITAITDQNCDGTSYGVAVVRKYPVPVKPEITVYFNELISSACCGNQWYKNSNPIPGATGQTYEVTENGLYFDIVTLNGCSSEPSDTVDMIVGIDETIPVNVSLYPNPANRDVKIIFPGYIEGKVKVRLYSTCGLLIKEFESGLTDHSLLIDVGRLEKGLYFVNVSGNHFTQTAKLILQ